MRNKDWSLEVATLVFSFAAGLIFPGPPVWAAPVAQKFVLKCRSHAWKKRAVAGIRK
jgi:hypothetical protein